MVTVSFSEKQGEEVSELLVKIWNWIRRKSLEGDVQHNEKRLRCLESAKEPSSLGDLVMRLWHPLRSGLEDEIEGTRQRLARDRQALELHTRGRGS